jgi:tetratricopeptide (TPR) repeat protein
MTRNLLFSALASLSFSGCLNPMLKGQRLIGDGRKAAKAERYEDCVSLETQALAVLKERSQVGSPGEREAAPSNMGKAYGLRASCYKALGKVQEAIADLEESENILNARCHRDLGLATRGNQGRYCEEAANATETLAQWKKDLAAKP